jgi:MFS family permease
MIRALLKPTGYRIFLVGVAGLGGLLYGMDIGVIAAALPHLIATIQMSVAQTSLIVAAVLAGSMLASPVAGFLANAFGRRTMLALSGVIFTASVCLVVTSHGFATLFAGRLLQGISCGIIATVAPLYLAECLSARARGRGTAVFQLMLTFGIAVAALIGWIYTRRAEQSMSLLQGNAGLILSVQDHAWRVMLLSVIYPGALFLCCTAVLSESPRWLFFRGKTQRAVAALRRGCSPEEAEAELRAMQASEAAEERSGDSGSLLKRKYMVPFLLVCLVLICNQATGINSVLGYLVLILRQAGLAAVNSTVGDVLVKSLNCLMTIVAIVLVDRKGRTFLLKIGTAVIVLSLLAAAVALSSAESKRRDVKDAVAGAVQGNSVTLDLRAAAFAAQTKNQPGILTVLYTWGDGDRMASVATGDENPVLRIAPSAADRSAALTIRHAFYGPTPSKWVGWFVAGCLAIYIAGYASGPGVVVWLVLSELMPMRIRSVGMGVALFLNQGFAAINAAVFLPVVGRFSYSSMFFFWSAATVIYFLTAAFLLPETKGKVLEEIEAMF